MNSGSFNSKISRPITFTFGTIVIFLLVFFLGVVLGSMLERGGFPPRGASKDAVKVLLGGVEDEKYMLHILSSQDKDAFPPGGKVVGRVIGKHVYSDGKYHFARITVVTKEGTRLRYVTVSDSPFFRHGIDLKEQGDEFIYEVGPSLPKKKSLGRY